MKKDKIKIKDSFSNTLMKPGGFIPWGVTSFEELDSVEKTQEHIEKANDLFRSFMLLADNIMFENMTPMDEQFSQMTKLSDEFLSRFDELAKEANSLNKSTENNLIKASNGTVSIYKQDNGLWWAGIPTNKFIDDDIPPDIFSSKGHRRFVKGLEDGLFEYPDLYLWHIPKAIGKATWVAYDERGFLVAGGIVYPQYHALVKELILNSDEILGMSHGIRLETIKRHSTLKHVIDEYNSFEFSFLPQDNAANKLTSFAI